MSRGYGALLLALGLLSAGTEAQGQGIGPEQAAIDRAVAGGVTALRRLQRPDGTWPFENIGATALAGLALLECGAAEDDPAVKRAADAVRRQSAALTNTYGLSLSIIFLDRLGDRADTTRIELMVVRLLAGQTGNGGWGYSCPGVAPRVGLGGAELVGGRDLEKLPPKGERKARDLAKETQAMLLMVGAAAGMGPGADDNSNTQFACLALWAGRRYGVPVQGGLSRLEARFRATQSADGTWGYTSMVGAAPSPSGFSASMTCAGVLGLAVGHGATADGKPRDVSKDRALLTGLAALSTSVGAPIGARKGGARAALVPRAGGKAFYFLWSLERVAVALDLKTIRGKDWYAWGAEVLLANQLPDGSWQGDHGPYGADTCFALLFLKRANLTRDLTSSLKGLGGDRTMRAGALPGVPVKDLKPTDIGGKAAPGERPLPKPGVRPPPGAEGTVAGLAKDLLNGSPERRAHALRTLREGKGGAYTDALASAIPQLEGTTLRQARQALAERLARMKVATLREYLKDADAEVRRAAALAATAKADGKALIPDLIRLLSDREAVVERAAHAALKEASGRDFGPTTDASRAERARAVADWLAWWKREAP